MAVHKQKKSPKKIKKLSWKTRLLKIFSYFTVGALLLISYQNCGETKPLVIDPPLPVSECVGVFCGGTVDYIYWNNCEAHILGWAWSDAGSASSNKVVSAILSNGASASTLTGISRPDVPTVYPTVTSNNSGFDCKFNTTTYTNVDLNIASITVQGAKQTFGIVPAISSITPSFCNGGLYKDTTNACDGSYAAFGWIDTASVHPTSCDLTISGWAWSTYAQANTKVTLLLSDGTYDIQIPIGESYPGVQGVYPCASASTKFTRVFPNKKFSATHMVNNQATVTGYGVATGRGSSPLNNILRFDVPPACRL